jgi:SsrA-binding protein
MLRLSVVRKGQTAVAGKSTAQKAKADGLLLIVQNRKARFDYALGDSFEAGISLVGSEVKSLREGRVEIVDAFVDVKGGQAWLKQLRIQPWTHATAYGHEVERPRRLLLHRSEIEKIGRAVQRDGMTVVPIRLYFKDGRVKVEIALAKGKRDIDKRADMAKKTEEKEARAAMARGRKGMRP